MAGGKRLATQSAEPVAPLLTHSLPLAQVALLSLLAKAAHSQDASFSHEVENLARETVEQQACSDTQVRCPLCLTALAHPPSQLSTALAAYQHEARAVEDGALLVRHSRATQAPN